MPNPKRKNSIYRLFIDRDGLKPDQEKIKAVQSMNQLSNTKELKTFHRFIQHLEKMSEVSAPVSAWRSAWRS